MAVLGTDTLDGVTVSTGLKACCGLSGLRGCPPADTALASYLKTHRSDGIRAGHMFAQNLRHQMRKNDVKICDKNGVTKCTNMTS